jgi:selenocysteine lyase/cysteine desulfurase
VRGALDDWQHGRTTWAPWERATGEARSTWARLHGVAAADVVVGPGVSAFSGLVAASLGGRGRVLVADGDFTSVLWPWVVGGYEVVSVPLEALPEAVDSSLSLVAVSAVQSADGRVCDLDALVAAASDSGVLTFVDATQSSGWLPLDASRFDFVAAAAYKWLLSPRGTAFMSVRPAAAERLRPLQAGWYAGDDPYETNYGLPLRLADDASRFDLSPAWFSWVGCAPALALLESVGIEAVRDHNVALANRLRAGLALPPSDSAIVRVVLGREGEARLRAAGVMATERDGGVRFSCHLWNTEADVDRALEALDGLEGPNPGH